MIAMHFVEIRSIAANLGENNVARPSGCRIETRLDACHSELKRISTGESWIRLPNEERRDESRRSRHECPRHVDLGMVIRSGR